MWSLDVAIVKILIVLLARVLHDVPVRPQRESASILRWPRISLGVIDGHLISQVICIRAAGGLGNLHLIAVRMAHCVEIGLVIEASGFPHKRLAVPMAEGRSHPRGLEL